jgi:hypothetical protein
VCAGGIPVALLEGGLQVAISTGDVCYLEDDEAMCEPAGLGGFTAAGVIRLGRRCGVGGAGTMQWGPASNALGGSRTQRLVTLTADARYSLSQQWMAFWLGPQLGIAAATYSISADGGGEGSVTQYAPVLGLASRLSFVTTDIFSLALLMQVRVTHFEEGTHYMEVETVRLGIDYPAWHPWVGLGLSGVFWL